MIKELTDRFIEKKPELAALLAKKHPEDYKELVTMVVQLLDDGKEYGGLDPEHIHEIDDGEYQGTLLYLIAEKTYQPSSYWYVKVGYGSCSGCDTLQDIRNYDSEPPTEKQVADYMTLALHIVQGIKKLRDDDE